MSNVHGQNYYYMNFEPEFGYYNHFLLNCNIFFFAQLYQLI